MPTFDLEDLMARGIFHPLSELRAANLPVEDRAILGSLPSREICAWTNVRIEEYRERISEIETYIATLHSLRNACAPISRLPDEVLMKVFGDFSLKDPCIRRVCRRWRRVVLATPSFWMERLSNGRCFTEELKDQLLLCAAIQHSGVRPISLHLQNTQPVVWRMLHEQRWRIAGMTVRTYDKALSSGIEGFFRSSPFESLRILKLESTFFSSRALTAVLQNCPSLEDLWLDGWTLAKGPRDDSDIIERAICLPQLRKLTVKDTPTYMIRMLRIFQELPAQTKVRLFTSWSNGADPLPPFDFDGLFTPSPINRLCIESFDDLMVVKGYAESEERLRMSSEPWEYTRAIRSFAPPASVLILNPRDEKGDWICKDLTTDWDLPHMRRLEITHTAASESKAKAVTHFLKRRGRRAGELSLAWALPIVPGQEKQPGAEAELQALLTVLRRHVHKGNPRLGALELYAIERGQEWKPFTGSVDAGSDARQCSQIAEPFLPKLRELANEVHIG